MLAEVTMRIVGASWGTEGDIVFSSMGRGILRVSADGGTPVDMHPPADIEGELGIHYPHLLPGGAAALVTVWESEGVGGGIDVLSLRDGSRRRLIDGGRQARYVGSGHILFGRDGSLMAVPFDLETLAVTGSIFPVVEGVYRDTDFAVSGDRTLAYVVVDFGRGRLRQLAWVDRTGAATPLREPTNYSRTSGPRLSPDGQRLAVATGLDDGPDVWLLDLERGSFSRLTVSPGPAGAGYPVWSRDGELIYFRSDRVDGAWRPFTIAADGGGEAVSLEGLPEILITSVSQDGCLVYTDGAGGDVGMLSPDPEPASTVILEGPFREHSAMLSPDDRFLAYVSDESGREQVYLRAFPELDRKVPISLNGGVEPLWSRDGSELFFRDEDAVMVVSISPEDGSPEGAPRRLFEGDFRHAPPGRPAHYDVHPDGQRFVMVEEALTEDSPREIHVVLNWLEEAERLVPPSE